MLARNFLTPAELKIDDKVFNALVQVLGMLERGELPWHKRSCYSKKKLSAPGFDMDSWPTCGTVGCIGFWTERLVRESVAYKYSVEPIDELHNLFYTDELDEEKGYDWEEISPEHAASALRNYLTTGKADWAGVLA